MDYPLPLQVLLRKNPSALISTGCSTLLNPDQKFQEKRKHSENLLWVGQPGRCTVDSCYPWGSISFSGGRGAPTAQDCVQGAGTSSGERKIRLKGLARAIICKEHHYRICYLVIGVPVRFSRGNKNKDIIGFERRALPPRL